MHRLALVFSLTVAVPLFSVQTMNAELEGAMVDALGSTFEFMAAGGK